MRAPLLAWEGWGGISGWNQNVRRMMKCDRAALPITHKERLQGIEWLQRWRAAHRDEEGGNAVQQDPLVSTVAAPLEGDGDDFADQRLWCGELTGADGSIQACVSESAP